MQDKVISIKNTEKNGNFSEVANVCWERRECLQRLTTPIVFSTFWESISSDLYDSDTEYEHNKFLVSDTPD